MFKKEEKIINKIKESTLSEENKEKLEKINSLLYNSKFYPNIKFPLLIITKNLDNIDITFIENTINEMLKTYKVFEGKLWDTSNYYGRIRMLSRMINKRAYKYELDKLTLFHGELKDCLDILEKAIDTNNSLILVECLVNVDEEFYKHSIYNKCDFVFEGETSLNNIINTLLLRYTENNIDYDLDLKKLNEIIEHNLNAKIFETEELCLQYMYNRSLKSYIEHKRKKLIIQDVPIYEDIDDIIDELNGLNEEQYDEPLYNGIEKYVISKNKISVALIQREFLLGYDHTVKIIELLEKNGIISIETDQNYRKVLIKKEEIDKNN